MQVGELGLHCSQLQVPLTRQGAAAADVVVVVTGRLLL